MYGKNNPAESDTTYFYVYYDHQKNAMEINVSQPWLGHILKGRKTIEGRLNKGKFAELRVGSIIIFARSSSAASKKKVGVVTRIDKYATFQAYLSQAGLERTLPGVATIEDGSPCIVSFTRRTWKNNTAFSRSTLCWRRKCWRRSHHLDLEHILSQPTDSSDGRPIMESCVAVQQ